MSHVDPEFIGQFGETIELLRKVTLRASACMANTDPQLAASTELSSN
jgi:hypothetical protein